MQQFYMTAALTLYSIAAWFIVASLIAGIKSAWDKHGVIDRRYFICGFIMLTLAGAIWAFNSSGAMVACEKNHSAVTCRAAIR